MTGDRNTPRDFDSGDSGEPADSGDSVDSVDSPLDVVFSNQLRTLIEQRYWAPIEARTVMEHIVIDPSFRTNPGRHLGLYSDHGVMHVRDVALRAIELTHKLNGSIFVERRQRDVDFVAGCAVLLVYLHDVGMGASIDRKVHAPFASQLVFSETFSDVLAHLFDEDSGGLRSRITECHERSAFSADPIEIFKEVLAFAVCHSKSYVPPEVLRSPEELTTVLRYVTNTPLSVQLENVAHNHSAIDVAGGLAGDPVASDQHAAREQQDSKRAGQVSAATGVRDLAFDWINTSDPVHRSFFQDVLDAVVIVRVADAMRQRGTTFRTSAGYEIVVDGRTGSPLAVLRARDGGASYLATFDSPISVGEANLRAADLRSPFALRFEFHRGEFASKEIQHTVARSCALAIDDVQRDVLETIDDDRVRIEIHEPHDDPEFARLVFDAFVLMSPQMQHRVDVITTEKHADFELPTEIDREPTFPWQSRGRTVRHEETAGFAERLIAAGLNPKVFAERVPVGQSPTDSLFHDVRLISLREGESIVHPHERADFVVIPTNDGLRAEPLGGYAFDQVAPFTIVGAVGVLRGHDRNATLRATNDLNVLVISAEGYLATWCQPFTIPELCDRFIANLIEANLIEAEPPATSPVKQFSNQTHHERLEP
jgi:hypothetical protein